MPLSKVKELLDRQHINYATINHDIAYTAQEAAAVAHVSGKTLAKTVLIRVDGRLAMAVVPASYKVDLFALQDALHARTCTLAREEDFFGAFPDCEPGAVPPFGNLYGMDVYVSEKLADQDEITICSGSHDQMIRLSYIDFEWLVEPKVETFARA